MVYRGGGRVGGEVITSVRPTHQNRWFYDGKVRNPASGTFPAPNEAPGGSPGELRSSPEHILGAPGRLRGAFGRPFVGTSRSLGVQLVPETQFSGSTATRTPFFIRKLQRVGKIQSIRRQRGCPAQVRAHESIRRVGDVAHSGGNNAKESFAKNQTI